MGFYNFIETFFYISLGITFVLILLLIYHFKQRVISVEHKYDTMVEIINHVVKEISTVKQYVSMMNLSTPIMSSMYNYMPFQSPPVYSPSEQNIEMIVEEENEEDEDENEEENEDENEQEQEQEQEQQDQEDQEDQEEQEEQVSITDFEIHDNLQEEEVQEHDIDEQIQDFPVEIEPEPEPEHEHEEYPIESIEPIEIKEYSPENQEEEHEHESEEEYYPEDSYEQHEYPIEESYSEYEQEPPSNEWTEQLSIEEISATEYLPEPEQEEIKIVHIQRDVQLEEDDYSPSQLHEEDIQTSSYIDIESIQIQKLTDTVEITEPLEPLEPSEPSEPSNLSNENTFKKMNIHQLKALAIAKGVATDVAKLKKNELIKLLENI